MSAPICWALRASFTREDAHTASCSAASAASGPRMKTMVREGGVRRASKDARLCQQCNPRNIDREARYVSARAGSSAPSTFAMSSSTVVKGVASSGSSVRACFSPITL